MADRQINRRRFFRQGIGELLRPLVQSLDPLVQAAEQLNALDRTAASPAIVPALQPLWLRPPGALPEQQFRDVCSRCGECVRACPTSAISIDTNGRIGQGVPFIDPDQAACVVCDELACMKICPTGALQPVPLEQINMGLAIWREERCLRGSGQSCTICVDKCPVGSRAIEIVAGRVQVHADGCIGCGVCQHECPTRPRSISVVPRAALSRGGPPSSEI